MRKGKKTKSESQTQRESFLSVRQCLGSKTVLVLVLLSFSYSLSATRPDWEGSMRPSP